MKEKKNAFIFFLVFLLLHAAPVNAQKGSGSSGDRSVFSEYGGYEEENEQFVPTRISAYKVITFPIMVILTPVAWPAYYMNTKEPKFKQSFANYWKWIHYEVPFEMDAVADSSQEVEAFRAYDRMEKREWKEGARKSYLPESEEAQEKALAEIQRTAKEEQREAALIDEPQTEEKKSGVGDFFRKIGGIFKRKDSKKKDEVKSQNQIEQDKGIQALLKKADQEFQHKNYDEAWRLYKEVLKQDLDNEKAQEMIGVIHDKKREAVIAAEMSEVES